jgi:tetratricopeptide (TPR) repeat protein
LFNYFYRAIPLYNKLKEFCSKNFENLEERVFFQNESFFESGPATKGLIYYRLQQPKNALRLLEAALTHSNYENKMNILYFMGDIYLEFGQYEKFFEVFDPLGDHREFISFTKKQKTRIFKEIKSRHELKENYDKAFECLIKIEEIEVNYNSKFNLDELLYTLQLISDVYHLKGDSNSARMYLKKRIDFQKKHKKDSSEVAQENESNQHSDTYDETDDLANPHSFNITFLMFIIVIACLLLSFCLTALFLYIAKVRENATFLPSIESEREQDAALQFHTQSSVVEEFFYIKSQQPDVAKSSNNIDTINEPKSGSDSAPDNESLWMGIKNTCHSDVKKISDNTKIIPEARDDTNVRDEVDCIVE